MDYKFTVIEITKAASRVLSALYTKYLSCGGMSFEVFTKLYSSLVEPVLYYGAGIWGQTNWKEVQAIQNKACRLFLGSKKHSSNIASQGDMGFGSTFSKQIIEVFRLNFRVKNADADRVTSKIHNISKDFGKSWEKRCIQIANSVGFADIIIDDNLSTRMKLNSIKYVTRNRCFIDPRRDEFRKQKVIALRVLCKADRTR